MRRAAWLCLAVTALGGTILAACDLHLQPYVDPVDPGLDSGGGVQDPTSETGPGGSEAGAPRDASSDAGDAGLPGVKRVFVTSNVTIGAMGGVAGGDTICQKQAAAANLGGTFVAWLSAANAPAIGRLAANGPWYLVDRTTRVFASKEAIITTFPEVPIDHDETGKPVKGAVGAALVWTGTSSTGQTPVGAGNCVDFTGIGTGQAGSFTGARSPTWTQAQASDCTAELHLYCFEQ
jgi:hypothetical protein